jgi:hypothetical protein
MKVKNPNVWKTVLEFIIAALTALAASFGTTSCIQLMQ